jgi:hypothetical protein
MVLYETLNDALIDIVKACGGTKAVGIQIWPSKGVEGAARHLYACLNPERNEKLSPDEVLLIVRIARDHGCHIYMEYLAQSIGYAKPVPVEPESELVILLREQNELRKRQIAMSEKVEKLLTKQQGDSRRRRVA